MTKRKKQVIGKGSPGPIAFIKDIPDPLFPVVPLICAVKRTSVAEPARKSPAPAQAPPIRPVCLVRDTLPWEIVDAGRSSSTIENPLLARNPLTPVEPLALPKA